LNEGLKEFTDRFTVNTNPGVDYLESKRRERIVLLDDVDLNYHLALRRKLKCVADEVGKDLAQPARVALEFVGHVVTDKIHQLNAFVRGLLGEQSRDFLHCASQIKIDDLQIELSRLNRAARVAS